jgi:hypothetical protein
MIKVAKFELTSHIAIHDVACKHWIGAEDRHIPWSVELDATNGWLIVTHQNGSVLRVPQHMILYVVEAPRMPVEVPVEVTPLSSAAPTPASVEADSGKRRTKRNS